MRVGDAVKKVTDALGIKQCGRCAERQRKLNELGERIARAIRPAEKRRLERERDRLDRS